MRYCRLYDFYPEGNEDILIDTMEQLKRTGDPWELVFSTEAGSTRARPFYAILTSVNISQYFPTVAVDNLENPFPVLTWHGVNMAEG